jgi:hypothetical protein
MPGILFSTVATKEAIYFGGTIDVIASNCDVLLLS